MDQGLKHKMIPDTDSGYKQQLQDIGYVTFPFLQTETIRILTGYYMDFQKESPDHFYSSTHSKDYSFRSKTSEFIKSVLQPILPERLSGYKLLGGAFVVKPANGKGLLPPHQDWNIVDEEKFRSFNLWIPLTDVSVENGAVFVLPGSHTKIPSYRGPGIPSLFKAIEEEVWKALKPLPMKAGEALFYDHALLHASPANTTDKMRLGIVCGMIPVEADMQLCFANGNEIEIYSANEDFFMEKDPAAGPQGLSLIRKLVPPYSILNAGQFNSMYLLQERPPRTSWLKRIIGIR